MDALFWHERWVEGRLSFHQSDYNAQLVEYWPTLGLWDRARVLVPLCGKSLDMVWLAARGHTVVGVELSPIAAEAFFAEQGLTPTRTRSGPFERFEAGRLSILCGDFFAMSHRIAGSFDAVYDRAASIALPPELRQRYLHRVTDLLRHLPTGLMILFEYDISEMEGPPFSVSLESVSEMAPGLRLETLSEEDVEVPEHLAGKGLTHLTRRVCSVRRS